VPGKGVDLAIRATARANLLWGSEGRFELRIAGDGPDLPRLIALVGSLRSDNCIHFLGTIDDVPGFWRSAAVAIHVPDTFIESFGLAPLEAVACGRRAIVSSTKASDEILGECSAAAAVPKGDFCGLAEQMAREARRGPATADEADRYHEWVVERFGIETTAQEYEEVLGRWLSTTR
jgi:glycosyltransferase involved in cell wall biosynthesis